jgi:hypothetical protein
MTSKVENVNFTELVAITAHLLDDKTSDTVISQVKNLLDKLRCSTSQENVDDALLVLKDIPAVRDTLSAFKDIIQSNPVYLIAMLQSLLHLWQAHANKGISTQVTSTSNISPGEASDPLEINAWKILSE